MGFSFFVQPFNRSLRLSARRLLLLLARLVRRPVRLSALSSRLLWQRRHLLDLRLRLRLLLLLDLLLAPGPRRLLLRLLRRLEPLRSQRQEELWWDLGSWPCSHFKDEETERVADGQRRKDGGMDVLYPTWKEQAFFFWFGSLHYIQPLVCPGSELVFFSCPAQFDQFDGLSGLGD